MPATINAPFLETVEIFTGNVATVNDAYDTTKFNNGARTTPGAAVYISSSTGQLRKYRYVRYNPTAAVTAIVGPVYWKDNTFTIVTPTRSESVFGDTINAIAGVLLNTSITSGNFGYIQTFGFLAAMAVPALTAQSDALVSATGAQALARVAAGTAPTGRVVAFAITAVSGGNSDVLIACEDI